MTVATAQYGNKDFDYPVIALDGYNGRLIGDDESGEEETETEDETKTETSAEPVTTDVIELKPTTPADVVRNFKQQTATPAPTPANTDKAPIPMAVPESLR